MFLDMKKGFISTLFLAFISFTQDVPEEILQELNLNQSDLVTLINSSDGNSNTIDGNQEQIETLQPAENSKLNTEKFGYDFFSKVPTNVTAAADLPVPGEYKISLNDEIIVMLTGSISKTYSLPVLPDGTILMPEIGNIFVALDTFDQVKQRISDTVANYYVGADVDISLKKLSAKKINIVGAVNIPGVYLVNPFSSISSALAYAGGVEEYGSLRNIKLIRQNGSSNTFDLYDILLRGDRSKDLTVEAGDTILVEGTDNFVELKGSVIRPGVYEKAENEDLSDLIFLALGIKNDADLDNILVQETGEKFINTKRYNIDTKRSMAAVKMIYVFQKRQSTKNNVKVYGPVSNSSVLDNKEKNYFELVSKLNFTNEVYPFIAYLEKNDLDGLIKERIFFNLKNFNELKNVKIGFDDKLVFFASPKLESNYFDDVGEEYTIEFNKLKENYTLTINISDETILFPIFGNYKLEEIINYLGTSKENFDVENIIYTQRLKGSKKIDNLSNIIIEKTTEHSVTIPVIIPNQVVVEIRGAVKKPGFYEVSGSTSVNELLILAGVESFADQKSIILQRESVRIIQERAIERAKDDLNNAIASNIQSLNSQEINQLNLLLNTAIDSANLGRISGNFSLNSPSSTETLLQNKDSITIPRKINSINILGEVVYPNTVLFKEGENINYYLDMAGGYTEFSNKRGIYILKSNGEIMVQKGLIFGIGRLNSLSIEPGDSIIIPRNYVNSLDKAMPIIESVSSILSNLAFASASLNVLKD